MEITDRAGAEKSQHRSITAARLSGDSELRGRVDKKFSAPQAETAARRTAREQWCRRVLDALPAAIYTTDTAGRSWVRTNGASPGASTGRTGRRWHTTSARWRWR